MSEVKKEKNEEGNEKIDEELDETFEEELESIKLEIEEESSIETLKEIDNLISENLRIRAEYDNFRKRTLKESERAYSINLANTIEKILPVIDNFDRAIGVKCKDSPYKEGMELILAQFHEVLTNFGVEEIEAINKIFDPQFHYAVLHEENDEVEQNTIVEVLQKGYILGDTVLRHAMVKVAN